MSRWYKRIALGTVRLNSGCCLNGVRSFCIYGWSFGMHPIVHVQLLCFRGASGEFQCSKHLAGGCSTASWQRPYLSFLVLVTMICGCCSVCGCWASWQVMVLVTGLNVGGFVAVPCDRALDGKT
eukprot:3247822-Pyramimonas_sp.AAC.1